MQILFWTCDEYSFILHRFSLCILQFYSKFSQHTILLYKAKLIQRLHESQSFDILLNVKHYEKPSLKWTKHPVKVSSINVGPRLGKWYSSSVINKMYFGFFWVFVRALSSPYFCAREFLDYHIIIFSRSQCTICPKIT